MADANRSIKSWPASERPREQLFERGVRAVTDAGLIAILLRTGTRGRSALDVARTLLTDAGSLRGVAALDASGFRRLGMGTVHAATLAAAFELGRRTAAESTLERPALRSPADVSQRYGPLLRDLKHEEFWAILLNSANRVDSEVCVSSGTLNASLAHPRECFADAVQRRAAAVIFVHNHPSGNPEPSSEDVALTKQLVEAGKILGIPVHDHVILAGDRYTSLADRRLM